MKVAATALLCGLLGGVNAFGGVGRGSVQVSPRQRFSVSLEPLFYPLGTRHVGYHPLPQHAIGASPFAGAKLAPARAHVVARPGRRVPAKRKGVSMFGDQFSEQGSRLAGTLFASSLFPYMGFLYFIGREEVDAHPLVVNGFRFLLVFVAGTIFSGVAARTLYGVPLADCDWLHGYTEMFLTITNLITALGFRRALERASSGGDGGGLGAGPQPRPEPETALQSAPAASVAALLLAAAATSSATGAQEGFMGLGAHSPFLFGVLDLPPEMVTWGHPEPENAVSVANWVIHWSSLVEFLAAMGLAWRLADATGNPRWKGMTWGMLPLHASGVTACTYHILYNSPEVGFLVPLQAALTCLGNTTLLVATWRLALSAGWDWRQALPVLGGAPAPAPAAPSTPTAGGSGGRISASASTATTSSTSGRSGYIVSGQGPGPAAAAAAAAAAPAGGTDSEAAFLLKLFAGSLVASYAVKYGELLLDFPFRPDWVAAAALICLPTGLNVLKWLRRSGEEPGSFDGLF